MDPNASAIVFKPSCALPQSLNMKFALAINQAVG